MTIGLVWAQSANGVIGRDNAIPWHVPEDMAHFRAVTAGATVLMGRRTWDSLPARFRPLPGRRNVVVTRDLSWSAPGAEVVHDIASALVGDVWVLGGAAVYADAMPHADVCEVTELRESFDGDVDAPTIAPHLVLAACDPADGWHTSTSGLHYRWLRYTRASTTP